VIRLGLRLAISGGREAVIRLAVLTAAVGLGVGLLLIAISGINAVNSQNDRYAWLLTGNPGVPSDSANPHASSQGTTAETSGGKSSGPLWWLLRDDMFDGQVIYRIDVAVTGPTAPVPPGIPRDPGQGQYYASPALAALLKATPASELGDRYPGHLVGTIGDAALPSPDSLVIIVGDTAAQLARAPGAARAASISATPPSGCDGDSCVLGLGIDAKGLDLVLPVVALAMLVPVLVFIATATRLSAARREQRFAAMRLTGAVPRQISVIAAVESTVAAVLGMAAGFGIFFSLRSTLAAIPFTGEPFFPGDLSLRLPDILIAAIGVPAAAAVAARLALHRVCISPFGVTRRVTPQPPRAWRLLPLLAGLAELGFWVTHGVPTAIPGQVQALLPGFALVMAGLVLAGPWLTMAGARIMVQRTSRAPTLIAARRLADNPRAAFRAVSGLVLALFITTVAAAIISTQDAKDGTTQVGGATASNILVDLNQGSYSRAAGYERHPALGSAPTAALLARLRGIPGVDAALVLYADPGLNLPGAAEINGHREKDQAGLVSCTQLANIPALGRCPAGAAVAAVDTNIGDTNLAAGTWPAEHVSAQRLDSLGALGVFVATNGSTRAVEQARTLLETAYPEASGAATFAEASIHASWRDVMYRQLADVVILVSLPIAGCTLAASIAAGLADRKRPFSMMRLAGAPLGGLRRVIALESAVPLLAVAVVAIGTGFGVSAMYATMQLAHPLVAPDAAYYLLTAAGIVVSLGIIAATFPLLDRLTGSEVARNELFPWSQGPRTAQWVVRRYCRRFPLVRAHRMRNSAGKTTTLRAIAGLIGRRGTVSIGGTALRPGVPGEAVAAGLSLVPQGRGTFTKLTVQENLLVGATKRRDKASVAADLDRWYHVFPALSARTKQTAGTLSGGEQQMLAVARSLMSRPSLLLCDEPSLGLAPLVVRSVFDVLREINAEDGTAMLIVEQNAELALDLASRVYLLEVGEVVTSGAAADLRDSDTVRRAYLGY
jgi:ABC-type branched-subunit amino acid transport system ATPase component